MVRRLALAVVLASLAACRAAVAPAPAPARPQLRPLGEATAADFRRAFEDAADRPRLVLGLSPT
ncbi:MAG TPA: hypothetical protein VKE22_09275 [Haliangiales bacterium]|nr:hypothetical protein [Haliangiales bacterium]